MDHEIPDPSKTNAAAAAVSSTRLNRRRWLKLAGGSLAVSGLGLGAYAWRVEPHWIDLVGRKLSIKNLPSDLAGKRLVQISDLHIGPVVDLAYIKAALDRVARLEPEIVVITGDFVTADRRGRLAEAAQALAQQPLASRATLAVLGNHDYGEGFHDRHLADELTTRLRDSGVTLLRNEAHDVDGLLVAGIDDLWSPRFSPREVAELFEQQTPSLVLAHNPDTCDLPLWGDYDGWVLSGHTHGGQCRIPGLPPPVLPVRNKRYVAGEYALAGGRRLYINRGLGYLRRVRFAARPEITVFVLERRADPA
ncbi:MAG: metallophosphoesterase [Pirellulales bacterium]